jgi:rubrerythrin
MDKKRKELLYQALETELGGIEIYKTAISCAVNDELKKEWREYHDQTVRHVEIVETLLEELGLDLRTETEGRAVVRHIGESLVAAMKLAKSGSDAKAAELVATECVVLAETKDHQNWELIGELSKVEKGETKKSLEKALNEVEEEEDEHLYHSAGWSRELWIDFLGMPAVIPPPEEEKDVKTATAAARAKSARSDMV